MAPAPEPQATPTSALCRLIAALGQADFMDEFARQCAAIYRAKQVTAFFLEHGKVRCALAHRPSQPDLVEDLCRTYTRQFERDPLLKAHLDAPQEFIAAGLMTDDIPDAAYRERFFASADLAGKLALISRRRDRLLYVNIYFDDPAACMAANAAAPLDDTGRILAETVHKHDLLTGGDFRAGAARSRVETFLRQRFPALSPREAQVCALIVCGYSAEAIALDLGCSVQTIVTFRRRAYAKMGLTSRSELFAHCAGLAM